MAQLSIKIINGIKFYPCCSWTANQHKMYYWETHFYNAIRDVYENHGTIEERTRLEEEYDNAVAMLEVFDTYNFDGIVYASYPMYTKIKEAIVAYDITH